MSATRHFFQPVVESGKSNSIFSRKARATQLRFCSKQKRRITTVAHMAKRTPPASSGRAKRAATKPLENLADFFAHRVWPAEQKL